LKTTLFSTADGYLSDRVSKGYEFELVGNPTRNWTVRTNYSYTDRTRTNVLTEGEGWWANRVALFKSLDEFYIARTGRSSIYNELVFNRVDTFTNQTVAQRIADSDLQLAATRFREQQGYGNRKLKVNLWTRYMLTEGKLNGLTFGGGFRYQSANVAGINVRSRQVYQGNPRSLFDGMLSYRTRGFFGLYGDKIGVTYQLNVTNLLDDRTITILNISTDTVTNQPYTVVALREDPRNATLTVRVAF
jgi:outer membrane receptor for ferric coprogen and ferric-rhodotorulic acid